MTATGSRKRVPLREGLFSIPDDAAEPPRLYGSRCPRCGARFAGARAICLACAHRGLERCLLNPAGRVLTFTIVRQTPPGSVMEAPYPIAQVRLDDGPTVQTVLTGVAPESVTVGMPVEMTLITVRQDDEGNDVVAYAFRPREEAHER